MNDDSDRTIFNIPEANYLKFEAQINKLSRRSMKLIGQEIMPVVFGFDMVENPKRKGQFYKVYNVLLTADKPVINGWTFVGRIDHTHETGNILRLVPNTGIEIPEYFRTQKPKCDHCNVNRFRRDVFIIRNDETGEFKTVGSTCLKDFFGHDPMKIARLAEYLSYAYECARGSSGVDEARDYAYIDLEEYLAHCAHAVLNKGWVSGAMVKVSDNPDLYSTSWDAYRTMFPGKGEERIVLTNADRKLASEALEWVKGFEDSVEPLSDYQHNVLVIAKSLMIEGRSMGLAASIVGIYQKNVLRDALRAKNAKDAANSGHVGVVGEKYEANAVMTKMSSFESAYGRTYVYRFLTDEGNILVWFASKRQNQVVGDKVVITGRVKKHDEYKGAKQTVLTRCKVETVE